VQDSATHCKTLQHTATHCNTPQHTASHCNTLQHTSTHCLQERAIEPFDAPRPFKYKSNRAAASSCSVLQCVGMRCNVLRCVAVCCSVLQCVAVRGKNQKNTFYRRKNRVTQFVMLLSCVFYLMCFCVWRGNNFIVYSYTQKRIE